MCWNADISLNTFLFATFSLAFIYFSNTYTKYKIHTFNNPLVYVFFLLVASMQLVEHFAWKNLDNKVINNRLSWLASFVVISQPMVLIWMIPTIRTKYIMLGLYTVFIAWYNVYTSYFSNNSFPSRISVAKNGHLNWEWLQFKGYEMIFFIIMVMFYLIPLVIVQNTMLALFLFITVIFSIYYYYTEHTIGTMWCWIGNFFMFYFLADILLVQPFMEYTHLC